MTIVDQQSHVSSTQSQQAKTLRSKRADELHLQLDALKFGSPHPSDATQTVDGVLATIWSRLKASTPKSEFSWKTKQGVLKPLNDFKRQLKYPQSMASMTKEIAKIATGLLGNVEYDDAQDPLRDGLKVIIRTLVHSPSGIPSGELERVKHAVAGAILLVAPELLFGMRASTSAPTCGWEEEHWFVEAEANVKSMMAAQRAMQATVVGRALMEELKSMGRPDLKVFDSSHSLAHQTLGKLRHDAEKALDYAYMPALVQATISLGREIGERAMERLIASREKVPGTPSHDELIHSQCANPHLATLLGADHVEVQLGVLRAFSEYACEMAKAVRALTPELPAADCSQSPAKHLESMNDKLGACPLVVECLHRLPDPPASPTAKTHSDAERPGHRDEARALASSRVKWCKRRVQRFVDEELKPSFDTLPPADRKAQLKRLAAQQDYLVAALVLRKVGPLGEDIPLGSMLLDELAARLPCIPDTRRPDDAKSLAAAPFMLERLTRGPFNQGYVKAMLPVLEALHFGQVGLPDASLACERFIAARDAAHALPQTDKIDQAVDALIQVIDSLHSKHFIPTYVAGIAKDEAAHAIEIDASGGSFKAALAATLLMTQPHTPASGKLAIALMNRLLLDLAGSGLPDEMQRPLREVQDFVASPPPAVMLDFVAMTH